jgi:hypothetical protein
VESRVAVCSQRAWDHSAGRRPVLVRRQEDPGADR